jgi:hypothetical protein
MKKKTEELKTIPKKELEEWTEEFKNMMVEDECPKCNWVPDCDDTIIAYGSKKYSYHLSLLSSFPQYVWSEIHKCPKCDTIFKCSAETI